MKRLFLCMALLITCGAIAIAQENPGKAAAGDPMLPWKVANVVLLVVGLGYLISKTLPAYFRSRTESIQKGISEAQQVKRDAEKRAAEMDARMNALGAEIERFRVEAHAEMEQEGARIREETGKQIEKLQKQAEYEIESAGKVARRELKQYAAKLALDLAEQRIRTRLDAATENGLVDGFIQDLGRPDLGQQGSRN